MEFKYKKDISLEDRRDQCNRLLIKNPTKIPIIVEKDPKCKLEESKKTRFLIYKDFTVNQFEKLIRNSLQVPGEEALFFTAKGKYTISGEKTMGQIYKEYKDKQDGFLYIAYSSELVYG